MIRKIAGVAVFALLTWTAAATAADIKIGFIDSARILAGYQGREDAERELSVEYKNWETQAEALKIGLDSLDKELQRQIVVLSDTKKRERQQEILQKKQEYETFVQSVFGPQGKLVEREAEFFQVVAEKINVILNRIAEEDSYDFVFDSSVNAIVYAPAADDLTDRILEELNQGTQ